MFVKLHCVLEDLFVKEKCDFGRADLLERGCSEAGLEPTSLERG